MIAWLRHQQHALGSAVRRLARQPVATLLTALAMGVAISLPSGLYLMLGNLARLAGDLPAQPEISVFVAPGANGADKQALAARLKQADIANARFIPKDEALADLADAQDLTDITAGLTENPLPDAWVVQPAEPSRAALGRISAELRALPAVADTHLDSEWADRLQAGLAIGRMGVWLLAGLFAIALVAISGNAIRAQVLARRDEIQVSRLIGATHRYIRRPFIYLGALQGLLGGLAAAAVLALAGSMLATRVADLASLYGSAYSLAPPTLVETGAMLGFTTLFGWLGAWIAVTRALRQIDSAQ